MIQSQHDGGPGERPANNTPADHNPIDRKPAAREGAGPAKGPGPKKDPAVAEAILRAAALLMPDYGYARVTMRDLARQAGLGLGTAYGHFRGKEEIAVELVARGVAAVSGEIEAIMDADLPPGDRLRRVLAARVTARLSQSLGQRHPVNEGTPELAAALAPRRAAWRASEYIMITNTILMGHGREEMYSGRPEALAQTLVWSTDGLVAEALLPPPPGLSSFPPAAEAGLSSRGLYVDTGGETLAQKAVRVADLLVAAVEARCPWTARDWATPAI